MNPHWTKRSQGRLANTKWRETVKVIQTKYNELGYVQIEDHGGAFLVSYPAVERDHRGWQREKVFNKHIGSNAWNKVQKFAAEKLKEKTK